LISNNIFPEEIEQLSQEPALPEYDEIFRTYLKDENKSKSHTSNVEESWKNDADRDKIREILALSKSHFNFQKERDLYENIKHLNPREVMEKFVILNHMVDNEQRMYLMADQNPFSITIFAQLFKKYSQDELMSLYMDLNAKYSMEFHRFQNSEIKRIATYTNQAGRSKLHKYDDEIKKIDQRREKYGYQFQVGISQKIKEITIANNLIKEQILRNIKLRSDSGISQTSTLLHLKNIEKGHFTKHNREVYKELIVEANSQLQLLKLPNEYKKYIGSIKEATIKNLEASTQKSLDEIVTDLANKRNPFLEEGNVLKQLSGDAPAEHKVMSEEKKQRLMQKLTEFERDAEAAAHSEMWFGSINQILGQSGDRQENFINSVIIGDEKDAPFEFNKMSFEQLKEIGAEVVADLDLKIGEDGRINYDKVQDDQKENLRKLKEMLAEVDTEENEADQDLYDDQDPEEIAGFGKAKF